MAIKVVVLALLLALASAQPANNECTGAITLTSRTTTNIVLTTATNVGFIGSCAANTETINGPDVWYQFNSGSNGFAHISSCDVDDKVFQSGNDVDTAFRVFSGSCLAPVCVAVSEDNCALASSLTFAVTPNTNYIVQAGIGRLGAGSVLSFYFELSNAPFNDVCGNAIDLSTVGTSTYTGSSIGAISEPSLISGLGCGGGVLGSNIVWYKFDSHTAQTANISTAVYSNVLRTYNTQIFVFEGSCASISSCIAGEDDILYQGFAETLLVPLQKNTTYYIAISGFEGSAGRYAFELDLVAEATFCDTAHHISLPSGYIPSSTFYADHFTTIFTNAVNPCAGVGTNFPIASAQWYTFNSGSYDRITIDTCSSTVDTQLYLTEGVCGFGHHFEQGNCVAFADGGCPSGLGAKLFNIALQQHHIYYVVLDSQLFADLVLSWVAGYQAQFA